LARARALARRAALLGVVLVVGACYKPKIPSGGFKCDLTAGAKACPDDFVCDKPTGLCVTKLDGGTAGAGGARDGGGGGGAGGSAAGGTGGNAGPCLPRVDASSCATVIDAGGMCDPVCNTGCADCHAKCSVDSDGGLTCKTLSPPPTVSTPPVGVLGTCGQVSAGLPNQTDNCAPGTVCLAPECNPRCFKFCRSDADCGDGAICSRDAGGGHKLCDVPPASCDPTKAQTGCDAGAEGCYLGADNRQTICDCPFNGLHMGGGVPNGQLCEESRQCGIGFACFNFTGQPDNARCVQVCHLMVPDGGVSDCKGGIACNPFTASNVPPQIYGYCPL
jgi:hypothetical protein